VALGGTTGILAGLVAVVLSATEPIIAGGLLASTLAGTGVGAWLGGMVEMSVGNRKIKNLKVQLRRVNFWF
jgi:hypothetical protein